MINKKYIFFRNDDVYRIDKQFLDIHNLFLKKQIPIAHGVIPGKTEEKLLKLLKKSKRNFPSLIDIAQHGWLHKNYNSQNAAKKYEFGPCRNYQNQKKDIIQGWIKLHGIFGKDFSPVFIPPYHAYDLKTLRVINELGERKNVYIFSSGSKTIPKNKNFLDIPVSVNFKHSEPNKPISPDNFLSDLFNRFKNSSYVGILLHHENYDSQDISALNKLLSLLKNNKSVKFILLSDLIKNKKTSKLDVTLEITNRCNLRCKICNIWKETPKRNISFQNIKEFFESILEFYSIGSVSLTGGEPFLNPQINKIFRFIFGLKTQRKIDSIGIYSNGYAKNTILDFLENNSALIENLDLGISLDGLKKNHNFLRGKNDAFQKTTELISEISTRFPQVKITGKMTINPTNFKDLPHIYRYCKEKGISLLPKFTETGSKYYYHKIPLNNFNTDFSGRELLFLKKIFVNIYKENTNSKLPPIEQKITKTIIKFISRGKDLIKECYTPLYSLFIDSKGDIYPCLYDSPISNITEKKHSNNLMKKEHLNIIKNGINNQCQKCFAYHGYLKNINI